MANERSSPEDLYMSVENYLNDISPAPSPATSPSKKAKNKPRAKKNPPLNFVPMRLPSASITTTYVKTLNELCTKCPYASPSAGQAIVIGSQAGSSGSTAINGRELEQIQPIWDVAPIPESPEFWKAKLKLWRSFKDANNEEFVESEGLMENEFGDDTPYSSKKHAKEAVAKIAVDWLEKEIEVRKALLGKTGPRGPAAKRKGSAGSAKSSDSGIGRLNDGFGDIVGELDGVNWVGILNNYTMQRRIPLPEYVLYENYGKTFSCEVRLAPFRILNPLVPIKPQELENLGFGDTKIRYAKKKLARMGAAKQAVEWLQIRDPMLVNAEKSTDNYVNGGSDCRKNENAKGSDNDPKIIKVTKDMAPRELLAYIAPRLGLMSPEYKLNGKGPIYNAKIFFSRPYEETDMEIGPVTNVFGKDRAKTEVAKLGVEVLKGEANRLGYKIVGLEGENADNGGKEKEPSSGEYIRNQEEETPRSSVRATLPLKSVPPLDLTPTKLTTTDGQESELEDEEEVSQDAVDDVRLPVQSNIAALRVTRKAVGFGKVHV